MPDLVSISNDLKTAPDQWLVQQSQNPSGAAPPYLVLAELQRRQLLRGGQAKPPQSSVAQDTVAATLKQISPPSPSPGPPPPPGMTPPDKGMPSGSMGAPMPGAKPPQNMRRGGRVKRYDEGGEVDFPEMPGPPTIDDLLTAAEKKYNLPPRLMHAVANQESNRNQKAVSGKGAIGIMQLMPDTAKELGVNPLDPAQNIDGGARYLAGLHKQYGGNLDLTLAGYNAGPGAVQKYRGVPPFKETYKYIKGIKAKLGQSARAALPQGRDDLLPTGPIVEAGPSGQFLSEEDAPPAPSPAAVEAPAMPSSLEMAPAAPAPAPAEEADDTAAAPAAAASATPWTPPESEELTHARTRAKEAYDAYTARSRGGAAEVSSAVKTLRDQRPEYPVLEAAIARLQGQAERSMEPDLGETLRTMGFALLASHQPGFGQALGEAGIYTTQALEKKRQAGRENYIEALKAGADLQTKKSAYDEKLAEYQVSQTRLNQQEVERLRKEADTAQKEFDKLAAASPAAQMQQRLNAINQGIVASGGQPVTDPSKLSAEDQNFYKFGVKPTATANKPGSVPDQMLQASIRAIAAENNITLPANPKLSDLPLPLQEKAVTKNAQLNAQRVIQQKQGESDLALNDPGALDIASEQFINTRALPTSVRSNPIMAGKIMTDAARKMKERGMSSTALVMEQNAAKAYQTALGPMRKQYENVEAFSGTLRNNMKILDEQAKAVSDLGAPILNMPLRQLEQKFLGDARVPKLRAAMQTVRAETARILNSANASGVITNDARDEMLKSLPDDLSYNALRGVLDVFTQEVNGRREQYKATLADITQHTVVPGGEAEKPKGGPDTPPPAPPPAAAGGLPQGGGKVLDKATAAAFFKAAGNDKVKARKLAQDNGWRLP